MKNLLRFILEFHFFILFIIIETFSLYLVFQYNSYQRASFLNSSYAVSGYIYNYYNSFTEYLSLKTANKDLAKENALLHTNLKKSFKSNRILFQKINDSLYQQHYIYISAKVINNSINKQYNYLTLNKGRRHGIKPEMAVVSPNGIVGIVKDVSNNFSSVISVLNGNLKISTKIKKNNYYGSLVWEGKNFNQVVLNEIPFHIKINIGDTVITSGYSAIFPEGILIGRISDFHIKKGDDFYNISVKLSTNFKNLSYVYVINNLLKQEQINLEKINIK
jgi:rod shape-determining protein MreC